MARRLGSTPGYYGGEEPSRSITAYIPQDYYPGDQGSRQLCSRSSILHEDPFWQDSGGLAPMDDGLDDYGKGW